MFAALNDEASARFAEIAVFAAVFAAELIGGIAAEIFGDVVALLAPPEPGELAAAVKQLSGHKLLQGIRGGPPVDIGALARIVDSVAGLLVDDPMVAEVDCNPVMVCKGKPLVVDALVVLADDAGA